MILMHYKLYVNIVSTLVTCEKVAPLDGVYKDILFNNEYMPLVTERVLIF